MHRMSRPGGGSSGALLHPRTLAEGAAVLLLPTSPHPASFSPPGDTFLLRSRGTALGSMARTMGRPGGEGAGGGEGLRAPGLGLPAWLAGGSPGASQNLLGRLGDQWAGREGVLEIGGGEGEVDRLAPTSPCAPHLASISPNLATTGPGGDRRLPSSEDLLAWLAGLGLVRNLALASWLEAPGPSGCWLEGAGVSWPLAGWLHSSAPCCWLVGTKPGWAMFGWLELAQLNKLLS